MSTTNDGSLVVASKSRISDIPLRIKSPVPYSAQLSHHLEEITSPSTDATLDHEVSHLTYIRNTQIQQAFTADSDLATSPDHPTLSRDLSTTTAALSTSLFESFNLPSSSHHKCDACGNPAMKLLYMATSQLHPAHASFLDAAIPICNAPRCETAIRASVEQINQGYESKASPFDTRKEIIECGLCGRRSLRAICAICRFSSKYNGID